MCWLPNFCDNSKICNTFTTPNAPNSTTHLEISGRSRCVLESDGKWNNQKEDGTKDVIASFVIVAAINFHFIELCLFLHDWKQEIVWVH